MGIIDELRRRLSLQAGTDREGTVARLSEGASLTAENLWLLVCSAILASIGLDVSSAAIIIGAMLISPLMGPILGVGLGMGITDRELLQRSLRELIFATLFCLLASAAYFMLSPLATATPELISRTRPTLLDVGVAFFGGIAGIVAGSRRHHVVVALPGVAIATALMPPLCTAGFGLATGDWPFFFSALYLYLLNAIFIALATLSVVRLLGFPHHSFASAADRVRERQVVASVAVLAALPSTYFLYDAGREAQEQKRIAAFVQEQIARPGRSAEWEHRHREAPERLRVFVVGRPIDPAQADSVRAALPKYRLDGVELELVQSDISARDLARFQTEVQRDILRAVTATAASRDSAAAARLRQDSLQTVTVARELAAAFPEILEVAFVPRPNLLAPDSVVSPPSWLVRFGDRVPRGARRDILTRAASLLQSRLGREVVVEER